MKINSILPWRVKKAVSWLISNRKFLVRLLLRPMRAQKYKYRIVVSSAFFGGIGGIEKLLKVLIESMPEADFYIFAREVRVSGFAPKGDNYRVNWILKEKQNLDLYVYFPGGGRPEYLGDKYRFRYKIIDTCGANIKDIEDKFDYVAIQTGMAHVYSARSEKWVFAFPNIPLSFPDRREPVDLPEHYYLTVFNPYSSQLKGGDEVASAADAATVPIVWCMNDKTGLVYQDSGESGNLIKLKNLTQEQLYYVYEHADAYISFSRSEGLGWAIAEAFYFGLPIISREVGVVTYIKGQPGVKIYNNKVELNNMLSSSFDVGKINYDYGALQEGYFENVIRRILEKK